MVRQADPSVGSFERRRALLDSDPDNLGLIAATIDAAVVENRLEVVEDLADRHARIAPLPASILNALGLAALGQGRAQDALAIFESLIKAYPDVPNLRLNLASARSGMGDHGGAVELIDADFAQGVPAAATLKVRALHNLGRVEEAVALGETLGSAVDSNPELAGGLALAALDAGDTDHAALWATKANGPDGDNVLAMLCLSNGEIAKAGEYFDRALNANPASGRAQIGRGLTLLSAGSFDEAGIWLDRGAETFGDHPGSWIAAGWAFMLSGDHDAARQRFERALSIDDALAEAHGGLAVLDVIKGDREGAERRSAVGARLDRQAMGPSLAKVLMLEAEGRVADADRIRALAMSAKVGLQGETLAESIQKFTSKAKPPNG